MTLKRRQEAYWEPIFDKSICDPFAEGQWDFSNQTGPRRLVYRPDENCKKTFVVRGVHFDEVDFEGEFEYRVVFINCTFKKCDFASSTFHRAKFSNCEFVESSFSLCYLKDCELRDCTFKRIGFSGNETILEKTLITNPSNFISGGMPNLAHLPSSKTPFEQKQRFEITRSTLARSLMAILVNEGSEENYYDGVKISTLQDCKAKRALGLLSVRDAYISIEKSIIVRICMGFQGIIRIIGAIVDYGTLWIFGQINSWGSSVARPAFLGVCLVFGFGVYYSTYNISSIWESMQKASKILLLFGYTKHSSISSENGLQAMQFINAIIGVFWYIVTIPTIVNKLTRVRG